MSDVTGHVVVLPLTDPVRRALRRLPSPDEQPIVRPKWMHLKMIERALKLGLIEEVSPGLYRRTAVGEAAWKAECWR
jgi:2-keto-3-deoxy-L-rhamnonate aldolase RhmA